MLVYDLRTATKWRILQGHEHAVSAVAFSTLGDHLASVSAQDRTLRWWQAGATGFFSFLGLQGSCQLVTTLNSLPSTEQQQQQQPVIAIEWTSPTEVTVTCNKQPLGLYSKGV